MSDEIVIIIINEKINVAFSRRTARTRNSHKKNKSREIVATNGIIPATSYYCSIHTMNKNQ